MSASPASLRLIVETKPDSNLASLVLRDAADVFLARHDVVLDDSDSRWQGLIDMTRYLDRHGDLADRERERELIAELGRFLAEQLLGPLMMHLWGSTRNRNLIIEFPGTLNPLAIKLAGIPWEMALHAGETLAERNLAVRLVTGRGELAPRTFILSEPLRVLLCFSLASASQRLAMRLERNTLLDLLLTQLAPERQLHVDVLQYGTTRQRLEEMVRAAGGYHIVHFSGHGTHDSLILEDEAGDKDLIRGREFAQLFQRAGGFYPELVFLGSCYSGSVLSPRDTRLHRLLVELDAGAPSVPQQDASREETEGALGAGLALVSVGISAVVAMRYAVQDSYARSLARLFYENLLKGHAVSTSLALARNQIAQNQEAARLLPRAFATPVFFGSSDLRLQVPHGRSAQVETRWPRPRIAVDALSKPSVFAGRDAELSALRRDWLERERPITVVQGLPGMGKTSLAAEVIDLWHNHFSFVLTAQAKEALDFEKFFRDSLHRPLWDASPPYRARCETNPRDGLWYPPDREDTPEFRRQRLMNNLLDACRTYRLLIVIDNFETNLSKVAEAEGHAASDRYWDDFFTFLEKELPGTGSRILVTTRWQIQSLARSALFVPLGPLSLDESRLLVQDDPSLRRLLAGNDADRTLLKRMLLAAQGHPLILKFLTALLDADRARLEKALGDFETRRASLVEQLSGDAAPVRGAALEYFEEATGTAVDLVLQQVSPQALRLLRIITLSADEVFEPLLAQVHAEASKEAPTLEQLLPELIKLGLITRVQPEHEGLSTRFRYHGLVRERISLMPDPSFDAPCILSHYAIAHGAQTLVWLNRAGPLADEQALEHSRLAIHYALQSRDPSHANMIHHVIAMARHRKLARQLLPELQGTREGSASKPEPHWHREWLLADTLMTAGEHEQALPHFDAAARGARSHQAWESLGSIEGNWGFCLTGLHRYPEAAERFREGIAAFQRADSPRSRIVTNELGLLTARAAAGEHTEVRAALDPLTQEIEQLIRHLETKKSPGDLLDFPVVLRAAIQAAELHFQLAVQAQAWDEALEASLKLEAAQYRQGADKLSILRTHLARHAPLFALRRWREARELLESCLEFLVAERMEAEQAATLIALSEASGNLGDADGTLSSATEALRLAERLGFVDLQANAHRSLAKVHAFLGDMQKAARHFGAALGFRSVMMDHSDVNLIIYEISHAMYRAGQNGQTLMLPTIQQLMSDPALRSLQDFYKDCKVNLEVAQGNFDRVSSIAAQGAATFPFDEPPKRKTPTASKPKKKPSHRKKGSGSKTLKPRKR